MKTDIKTPIPPKESSGQRQSTRDNVGAKENLKKTQIREDTASVKQEQRSVKKKEQSENKKEVLDT